MSQPHFDESATSENADGPLTQFEPSQDYIRSDLRDSEETLRQLNDSRTAQIPAALDPMIVLDNPPPIRFP
ncbi:hypothetical protein BLNAU_15208 [Blattamonas nauphoetae]|uniref:Uncharacterized protein n=1 Tax=Blattamonas nauphoetae TaxID=2049346 RepID=A0ABQ9XBF0_9EUKA|nr:hypothetical protein BLNAU_15208 [Blattamonas nauphoetae]